MLAIACPSCGAPCRVSLDRADVIACTGCGKRQAPPQAAKERLAAAERVLSETSERARQLHGYPRALVRGAFGWSYVLVAALLAVWSASAVRSCQPEAMETTYHVPWVLPIFGASLALLVALPAFVSMARSARRVRQLARAAPPLAAGEPASCRVCGGPLGTAIGVVRCRHCRADNLLDAGVMARAGERHAVEVRDLEDEARALTADIADTRVTGLIFSVALSVFAVPAAAIFFGDNALEYANVPLGDEVSYAVEEGGGSDADFRTCLRSGHGPRAAAYYGDHHPRWIVGHGIGWTTDRVIAVKHNLAFGDVVIGASAGASFHVVYLLEGICVQGMPPGVTSPKNPKLPALTPPPAPATSVRLDDQPIDKAATCHPYVDFLVACGFLTGPQIPGRDAGDEDEMRLTTKASDECKATSTSPYDERSIHCYQTAIAPLTNPALDQPTPNWRKPPGTPRKNERARPECKAWLACTPGLGKDRAPR
jgi:hypothetical protein